MAHLSTIETGRRLAVEVPRVTPGGILMLLVLLVAVPADAVVVCAKKSGRLLAREACKKRETPALPGAVALVGPAGGQGPTGPGGPVAMLPNEVVDATGKQFATTIYWLGSEAQVVTAVQGVDVPVQFIVDILNGTFYIPPEYLYYEQPDCVGAPLYADGDALVPIGRVFGTRFYVSRTAPTDHPVESYEYVPEPDCGSDTPTERQTCCTNYSSTAVVAPVDGFDVSILGVTPPFSVAPR
jgi:hypothetical protein